MSTIWNRDCELIEAEARRMVSGGFQVKCLQDAETEDFMVSLTKGARSWKSSIGINSYEDHDWRACIRRAIRRELKRWRTRVGDLMDRKS